MDVSDYRNDGQKAKVENLRNEKMRWELEAENRSLSDSEMSAWRRNNKCNLRGLMVDGVWCEDPMPVFCNNRIERILVEEVRLLEKGFNEKEIWDAICGYGGDKAPGPNGFNFKFIKIAWDIIKSDLICAVQWFWDKMEISRGCNASFITIVPKVTDPICLNDFRQISLMECYYKIIAKMLAERVKRVVGNVVGEEQNAFIKGRFIHDGVLIANETMEYLKKKKEKNLIFKVDFEKAYDSINWRFLLDIMKRMRQGDPLSPFLFILAAEGLNAIVTEAVEKGIFRGVMVGTTKVLVSHLQYADDTIFFGEWNKENAKSLMCIHKCFEEVYGLKVNYNKSNLYCIGVNEEEMMDMARWMGCGTGEFPFTYLGLPIGKNMGRVSAWGPMVDKFKNKLADLKAKTMSFGGRLTLGVRGGVDGWGVWSDIGRIGGEIDGVGIEFTSSCVGLLGDGRDIRFWVDRWVDNMRLCDRFPRLYHLDTIKEGSVMDKGSWVNDVWCWERDWVRNISGRVNREFEDLLGVVQNIVVHWDKWRWTLDKNGEFTVKELARLVEEKILHTESGGHETLWNILFPKKVNIFV
nr:protein kinase-like domain, beta-lactamase/transpeptidase-like protein [Tanacetum cinerariifolium]